MGYGAGLAGFVNGFDGGLSTGAKLSGLLDQHKLAKVREQGIAEAQAMQAKAAPQVVDNGDMQNLTARPQMSDDPNMAKPSPVSQGLMAAIQQPQQDAPLSEVPQASRAPDYQPANPMAEGLQLSAPKRFGVAGKEFDDRKDADAYSKSKAPPASSFYKQTLVPKMYDMLISQGKPEEAERYMEFAEKAEGRESAKSWLSALKLSNSGDMMGAANAIMEGYKMYDDGFEIVSSKEKAGPDGLPGMEIVVKGEDGNERTMFHNVQTIVQEGLMRGSPLEVFKKYDERHNKMMELKGREAISKRDDDRDQKNAIELEGVKAKTRFKLEEDDNKARAARDAERAKENEKRDAAKAQAAAGRVKQAAELRTQIKKGDDPAKMRLRAYEVAAKNPMWATMDEAERETEAKTILEFARAEQAPAASSSPAGTVANPFVKPKGVPKFRNGQIVYE